jgi:hypothetical protein
VKLSFNLSYEASEQAGGSLFRTTIIQMLARPHERMRSLSVAQNLVSTSNRHHPLTWPLGCSLNNGRHWALLL